MKMLIVKRSDELADELFRVYKTQSKLSNWNIEQFGGASCDNLIDATREERSFVLYYLDNDLIKAYMSVVLRPDEQWCYLGMISTKFEHRNQGIGEKMLAELKDWCRDNDYGEIRLIPLNNNAERFFQKRGFVFDQNKDKYVISTAIEHEYQ